MFRSRWLMAGVAGLVAGCGGGGGGGSAGADAGCLGDGGFDPPGRYDDPLVEVQRLPGSTFVEIGEVRAGTGGAVYFCSGVRGLNVVDATDPGDMRVEHQLISQRSSSAYPRCQHLAVAGDRVYFTNRGDQIQPTPFVSAFRVDATGASELATYVADGRTFEGIAVDGDRIFVAQHADGIAVLTELGDSLVLDGEIGGLTNAWGVAVAGERLYVADGVGGLAVVEAFAGGAVLGRVALEGSAQHVEIDAATATAWVAAGSGGLYAVDVSNPSAPVVVGRYDSPGIALQVAIDGDRAVLADWNDLRLVDISDPTAPFLLATERIATSSAFPRVLGAGIAGDSVFAGEWTGLHSLAIRSDASAPDLWLGARRADFGPVAAGSARARAIIVENQGTEPLAIEHVVVEGAAWFSASRSQLVVEPGSPAVIEVTFSPGSDNEQRAQLALYSDDPDEPRRAVELVGNTPQIGVGDPAPEATFQRLDGGSLSLGELRGQVVVLSYFATF